MTVHAATSLSTPLLRSPQVNGKPLRKSASVQMVGTDIEIEEREMRPAPHEGPLSVCSCTIVVFTDVAGSSSSKSSL
jgi:hypothetical protein